MPSAGEISPTDIRDQLRRDHELALAELEALRHESGEHRGRRQLAELRRSWLIDTLAKETVVYRAIEGVESGVDSSRTDQRFVKHELLEGLFEKLAHARAGSLEWLARVEVARELMARLIETEHEQVFGALAQRFDAAGLARLGESFEAARAKLAMLEEAKAA
ncbi:MAG: hypothetical protein ABI789_03270 [Usitatibacter sp.]